MRQHRYVKQKAAQALRPKISTLEEKEGRVEWQGTCNRSVNRRWHRPRRSQQGAIAGAITVLVVWILGMFNVAAPPEVASAFTVIISFAASYFVRERVPVAADNTKAADS